MKSGIVIVNYNRGNLVKEISSIFSAYKIVDKIVIVDNNSTDNSVEILQSINHDKIEVFAQYENLGYARGNNVGLRYLYEKLNYDYAFIVNPDVYFTEEVLIRILSAFEVHSDYAVITTARVDPDSNGKDLQYSRSYFGTYSELILSMLNITRHYILQPKYGVYEYDINNHSLQEICVAPGSFFGVRLSMIKDIDYLDEGTFLYGEEACLATRLERIGYKEGFLSDVVYEHRHIRNSTTSSDKSLRSYKFMLHSKYYYSKQYMHINNVKYYMLKSIGIISILEMKFLKRIKSFRNLFINN